MAASLYPADTMPTNLHSIGMTDLNPDAQDDVARATWDLEQRVNETMRQSQYRQLGRIICRVDRGIATLHGRVSSFYLKQLAQEQAARVEQIGRVVNLVEVIYA